MDGWKFNKSLISMSYTNNKTLPGGLLVVEITLEGSVLQTRFLSKRICV